MTWSIAHLCFGVELYIALKPQKSDKLGVNQVKLSKAAAVEGTYSGVRTDALVKVGQKSKRVFGKRH